MRLPGAGAFGVETKAAAVLDLRDSSAHRRGYGVGSDTVADAVFVAHYRNTGEEESQIPVPQQLDGDERRRIAEGGHVDLPVGRAVSVAEEEEGRATADAITAHAHAAIVEGADEPA
ncbi:hypothetical protein HMPREF9080_02347 [Cardiobacterium valvarum F0432]|uniref:Uncharacterized protein n=1 Tax=Cardiobacterium valvarum F0432 TaxID=797473 RepID=G9ZHT9_9GAMM|nr:hypothetical protein HMPREF9080_02347 [Cardiobacterium valvarum F0432]